MADGAIAGFNLAAGVKALQNGQFGGWDNEPSAKTDFSSLTATCDIANGVLDNRDLEILSPVLGATGDGKVDLAARTLDYTVRPVLKDADGQGVLSVPAHLTGPWTKPDVKLDLSAIAKNPQAAVDTVKKAVGKFAGTKQGKAIGDLLGGLLGKITKQPDPPADPAPPQ
jgi:AsmA protein